MSQFIDWRTKFRVLDEDCPWPGPVPLYKLDELDANAARHAHRLVGRDQDKQSFVRAVLKHPLVVLHGSSGVGKSSLVNVGLIPELSKRGFVPLVFRQWEIVTDEQVADPDAFLEQQLWKHGEFVGNAEVAEELDPHRGLIAQLDELYADNAVIVLDQFEELIRYKPEQYLEVLRWLVRINRSRDVRVVVSLRSEHVHNLRALMTEVRQFSATQLELAPITDPRFIREIIESGNVVTPGAIDATAADLLVQHWEAVPEGAAERGLLLLQASLYALWAEVREPRASETGPSPSPRFSVTRNDVTTLARGPEGQPGRRLFAYGLDAAIDRKLQRCASVAAAVTDETMVQGALACVREAASRLSSAGFKLEREVWDLARESLRDDLTRLAPRGAEASRSFWDDAELIFRAIMGTRSEDVDLLASPRESLVAHLTGELGEWCPSVASDAAARFDVEPAPWVSDPGQVSAGPMLGLTPRDVLIEELRRAAFAMTWLEEAALVRPTTLDQHTTMYSLVHDGFGEALIRWATTHRDSPDRRIHALTAVRGQQLIWPSAPKEFHLLFDGGEHPDHFVYLVNLRWQDCEVESAFRRVVFVNCDFRGTSFKACRFEGVTFLNCLLDNSEFDECAIVRTTDDPTAEDIKAADARSRERSSQLPSFVLDPAVDTSVIARYREVDPGERLVSVTSGLPAIPWEAGRPADNAVEWRPQNGGLSTYGGRLSSIQVKRCSFEDSGQVSIRHTAGSSLDFVEHDFCDVHVFDSTIRALAITPQVGQAGAVTATISDSVVSGVWFDRALTGSVDVVNAIVLQLLNVSAALEVRLANCKHTGTVGVITDPDCITLEAVGHGSLDLAFLADKATPMSYRSTPAKYELELRKSPQHRDQHG